MRLIVIGSSSSGNCYLLDNGKECLVIECGMPFIEVKKKVQFDISRIVGVLLSHEHKDHSKEVKKVLESRINVFCSNGTAEKLGISDNPLVQYLRCYSIIKLSQSGFNVMAFSTKHDAAEPLGFLISHPECGTILFATDTYYLPNKFKGLNNILLECNYDKPRLLHNYQEGIISKSQLNRTLQSHLSFENCKKTLLANDLSRVNNIVLIHLSDNNSDAKRFKEEVEKVTLKKVTIADKGVEINFNKYLF